MRWWGRILVPITIIATVLAIISFFTDYISTLWAFICASLLWGLVVLGYIEVTRQTKKTLDGFIGKGNQILAQLTTESWDAIDRYDFGMDEWATNVRKLLRTMGYENYWMSNPGLVKEEVENQEDPIKENLSIKRNYMKIRLQRLHEIRRRLGD